jgi:hypothetical protein
VGACARGTPRHGGRQRGSIVPLVALLVVLAGAVAIGLGRLGAHAVEAGRARTAADAAALAGAAEGIGAARAVAAANGAVLVDVEDGGEGFRVWAEVGGAVASSAAVREGGTGGTAAGRVGLQPEMVAALAKAEALLGTAVPVTSGWRSRAQQHALWARRTTNPYPVARPGTSAHEAGRAVDVARSFVPRLAEVAAAAGLCRPLPRSDPVHFELCGPMRGP